MLPRAAAPLAALLLLAAALPGPGAAPATCPPGNPHVWFLGLAYDIEQDFGNPEPRDDFVRDVENFEYFLDKLRDIYCIPANQAAIYAFKNNYYLPSTGKTYAPGTEENLKAALSSFAAQANPHSDALVFFFLSSHGNVYLSALCPTGPRAPGSYAYIGNGFGPDDGVLVDCELGDRLTTLFQPHVRMVVGVDCSFCGGFSDSLTAASGTLPDNTYPTSSGVPAANRVVMTGCAITTECFGSTGGGVSYKHLKATLQKGIAYCDGWTAPLFPQVQGLDVPTRLAGNPWNVPDGQCTASEWFYGAVNDAYVTVDLIGYQQQFRMKYGFPALADDIRIM